MKAGLFKIYRKKEDDGKNGENSQTSKYELDKKRLLCIKNLLYKDQDYLDDKIFELIIEGKFKFVQIKVKKIPNLDPNLSPKILM